DGSPPSLPTHQDTERVFASSGSTVVELSHGDVPGIPNRTGGRVCTLPRWGKHPYDHQKIPYKSQKRINGASANSATGPFGRQCPRRDSNPHDLAVTWFSASMFVRSCHWVRE